MRFLLTLFIITCSLEGFGQNNYVVQTAPSSFGAYVIGGVNIHSQDKFKGKSAVGYQTGFGMAFFKHFSTTSIDLGLSYGNQWMHYKEENLTDSLEGNYGMRFKYIGIPIGFTYRLSQNKSRGIMVAGIEPSFVFAPSLYELESSSKDVSSNTYFPQSSNKKPLNFQIYGGLGRSFDLSREFMLRAELRYQMNTVSVFDSKFMAHSIMLRFLFLNHN